MTGDFLEAIRHWQSKGLLPTNLSSAQLSGLEAAWKRQNVFSARTAIKGYLGDIKDAVGSVVNPRQVVREGQTTTVTEGLNPATARQQLREALQRYRYTPAEGEQDTIKDLSSDVRINLVVKTNTELAQGAGQFVQQNADPETIAAFPALELYRLEERKDPRDWEQRWRIAAQVAGDAKAAAVLEFQGRMVALKSSGIWQALGDGAGGYMDTLGNPYPPFAFNSGMWTEEISRASAIELGLIGEDDIARPAAFNLASLFSLENTA